MINNLLVMRIFILLLLIMPFSLSSQTYVDSVYEFEVGDEFHYEKVESIIGSNKRTKKINKILNKSYSGTRVNYQIHSYGRILVTRNPIVTFSNIINVSYDTSYFYDTLPSCPLLFCSNDSILTDSIYGLSYLYDTSEWHYGLEEVYSKKLGKTRYYEQWPDAINPRSEYENLVYFKKDSGNWIWGTPYTFTSSVSETKSINFSVYPNPTSHQIQFNGLEKSGMKYKIINSIGKILLSGKIESNQIDCSTLPNGIYLLKVNDGDGKSGIKRIVISR